MRRKRFRDDHQWWPQTPTTGVIGRRKNYHSCEFNVWNLLQHSHFMNKWVKQTAATEKPPHTNLKLQVRKRAVNVKLWMNEWIIQHYLRDRFQLQISELNKTDSQLVRNVLLQRIKNVECDVSTISADKYIWVWKERVVVYLKMLFQY